MHIGRIEDARGDTVDMVDYCSDSCHRQHAGDAYAGWDGAHELEHTDYCAACGVVIPGFEDACDCQLRNVAVNRFLSDDGERCKHGRWIQVPRSFLFLTVNGG